MAEKRKIAMKDGRTVEFGENQKMIKDYGVRATGLVFCQIDFDNGETVVSEVDPTSPTGLAALGHGLSQKLGDSASGAENTNDAFESVLEVAARIAQGEWNKNRSTGDGTSAKGASELVEAMVIVLGKDKETVRAILAQLKQADKMGLRKTPKVAAAIERIRASRGPSKAEKEKAAANEALLANLQEGKLPVYEEPAGDAE